MKPNVSYHVLCKMPIIHCGSLPPFIHISYFVNPAMLNCDKGIFHPERRPTGDNLQPFCAEPCLLFGRFTASLTWPSFNQSHAESRAVTHISLSLSTTSLGFNLSALGRVEG